MGARNRLAKTPTAYWRRLASMVWRYGTAGKVLNAARAYLHYLRGTAILPTKPCFLKVEISRKCTVNCLYCRHIPKADRFYPLDRYKAIIDELAGRIFAVSLYDIGEPLENPDVLDYVRYAHGRRVGTVLSSSLSVRREAGFWAEMVRSGLDRLIVAIDGITPEIYNRYRTGGDFALVMANLRELLRCKAAAGVGPYVEWQMLDLPWNRREQGPARAWAEAMGCDGFRLIAEATRRRADYEAAGVIRRKNCLLPYIVCIINAYNHLRPCYKIYKPGMVTADLNLTPLAEAWNSDGMAEIRDRRRISARPHCRTCRE